MPGHGGKDSGALNRSKGLVEKTLNLKIAKYLEEELNKYYNVKVLQTHDGVTFPDNNYGDLAARAMIARNNNADLYVSLHINSNNSSSVNGSDVYVTYRNDLPKYNAGMTNLGNKILDNLSKLGIAKGRVRTRLCIDDSPDPKYRYYDKKLADYYGDIRYAMKGNTSDYGADLKDGSGIPTVLIEHCYISNDHDAQFLDSDEDLKKLAQADVKAIVDYLELKLPSEINPTIKVSNDSEYILLGNTNTLKVTTTPSTMTNKTLIWESSNPDVAEVSNDGTITSKKAGEAIIKVTWQEQNLSDTTTVHVIESPQDIKIEMPKYNLAEQHISKIGEKVTFEEFLKNINISDNIEVEIKGANKDQIYVGTNTKVIIKEKEHHLVLKEYNCLLYGDVNGDGKISAIDYTLIKNDIMNVQKITDANAKITANVNRRLKNISNRLYIN